MEWLFRLALTNYDTEIQTVTANNTWLVIAVSSLQISEDVLPLLPLVLFLPKLVTAFENKRKRHAGK